MPLDVTIPSTRLLQSLIKEGKELEIKLLTGDQFKGKILWQDPECFCLGDADGQQVLLSRPAVAFMRLLN